MIYLTDIFDKIGQEVLFKRDVAPSKTVIFATLTLSPSHFWVSRYFLMYIIEEYEDPEYLRGLNFFQEEDFIIMIFKNVIFNMID